MDEGADEDQGERNQVIVKVEECDTGQVEMFTWTSTIRDGGEDIVTSPTGGLEVHSDGKVAGNPTEMSSSDGSLSSHIMNPQCHHMHPNSSAALSQDLRSAAPRRTVSYMPLDDNGTGNLSLLPVCKEEVSPEREESSPSLVQVKPEPPQIKGELLQRPQGDDRLTLTLDRCTYGSRYVSRMEYTEFPRLPVRPPEHKERNSSLVQKEPEPPQIKQEQEEEPLQRPEEATGSSLTPLAVKTEEDDENMTVTEPVASTSTEHMKTQADAEDGGTPQPSSYCQPLSSHSSDEDTTEDSGDEWEENREDQSALNKLNSQQAQNVEGQRLARGQKSSKQTKGKKSCTCTECGKVLGCTSYLKRHMRTHTGLKTKAPKVLRRHRTGQGKTCSPRPSDEEEEEKEDEDGTPRLSGVWSQSSQTAFTSQVFLHKHLKRSHGDISCQMLRSGQVTSAACQPINGPVTSQKPGGTDQPRSCSGQQSTKTLTQPREVKTHRMSYTGKKKHACKQCEQSFSHLSQLERHQRVHTGERPFQCSRCDKSFSLSQHLKSHQHVHTAEKSFQCSQCDRSFSQSGNLTIHQRVHTGEKSFQCSQCDRSFSQSGNLTRHQRVHTGEKPFHCSQCDKSFSQSQHLKSHQHVHTGERPFQCNHCDKSFSRSDDLTIHQRVHTGEKQ